MACKEKEFNPYTNSKYIIDEDFQNIENNGTGKSNDKNSVVGKIS